MLSIPEMNDLFSLNDKSNRNELINSIFLPNNREAMRSILYNFCIDENSDQIEIVYDGTQRKYVILALILFSMKHDIPINILHGKSNNFDLFDNYNYKSNSVLIN